MDSNAIKFSKAEGTIDLNAEIIDNHILINILDNGVGFSREDQEKLWDYSKPYTTLGTNNEKETGLGLLICKEFVEKHNGLIWVESEKDKGCNFKIKLPLLQ